MTGISQSQPASAPSQYDYKPSSLESLKETFERDETGGDSVKRNIKQVVQEDTDFTFSTHLKNMDNSEEDLSFGQGFKSSSKFHIKLHTAPSEMCKLPFLISQKRQI